jgi:hypothetical protein
VGSFLFGPKELAVVMARYFSRKCALQSSLAGSTDGKRRFMEEIGAYVDVWSAVWLRGTHLAGVVLAVASAAVQAGLPLSTALFAECFRRVTTFSKQSKRKGIDRWEPHFDVARGEAPQRKCF